MALLKMHSGLRSNSSIPGPLQYGDVGEKRTRGEDQNPPVLAEKNYPNLACSETVEVNA